MVELGYGPAGAVVFFFFEVIAYHLINGPSIHQTQKKRPTLLFSFTCDPIVFFDLW